MNARDIYFSDLNQMPGLRGLRAENTELHVVGEINPKIARFLDVQEWADIIIHDPPWNRGICDDRHCVGDRRTKLR